ncbi:nucleotidyltransferase domain-containing protein [Paucisalibacillus sp. EB02]|uniref:nucleotidyltransferase domain-containing protein n=1 Tax=Paucisalibacillus sp. EB02 TaxID=1347087 RepID=UPI0005A71165|nr:nucleotidyltransferase domain-containing protein [Paucisalibacillus sp. EB02]
MKEKILNSLRQIEQTYQVIILYACEAGSRAWGLASEISDYDIRFIYAYPTETYLSIDPIGIGKNRDVIENITTSPNKFDINGWELTKSLRLFRKSNPSLLEWLHSPIVYDQAFSPIPQMKKLFPSVFNQKACILHYINMALGNYEKILKEEKHNIKTIINIFRPLLAAKWIEQYGNFPPLNFQQLVDTLIQESETKENLHLIINQKLTIEISKQIDYHTMLQYSYDEIEQIKNHALSLETNTMDITEKLNTVFRHTLSELDDQYHVPPWSTPST